MRGHFPVGATVRLYPRGSADELRSRRAPPAAEVTVAADSTVVVDGLDDGARFFAAVDGLPAVAVTAKEVSAQWPV